MRSRPTSASPPRRCPAPTTTTPPTRSSRRSTPSTAISATGTRNCAPRLASLEIDAPNGKIKLDDKRQAIAANFVTEVVEAPNGDLVNKMVKFVPEREPDARLRRSGLRQARPAEPHQSGMQEDRTTDWHASLNDVARTGGLRAARFFSCEANCRSARPAGATARRSLPWLVACAAANPASTPDQVRAGLAENALLPSPPAMRNARENKHAGGRHEPGFVRLPRPFRPGDALRAQPPNDHPRASRGAPDLLCRPRPRRGAGERHAARTDRTGCGRGQLRGSRTPSSRAIGRRAACTSSSTSIRPGSSAWGRSAMRRCSSAVPKSR